MKNFRLFATSLLLATGLMASAIPAKRIERTMTQPDGTQVSLRLVGDEFHHYYLTKDNQVVIGYNGAYFFAQHGADGGIVASKVLASDPTRRTTAQTEYLRGVDNEQLMKAAVDAPIRMESLRSPRLASAQSGVGLYPGATFPTKGNVKGIVILVEYKDVKFKLSDPVGYFTDMMMKPGFSEYNGTGSAYDYFTDSSNGQFIPEFDVYGPVTLANNRTYYGGNDPSGNDKAPEKMISEACKALDDLVNFKDYDTDGDGYVDNVFVFYAGQGEASYGPASSVWPHAWELSAAGVTLSLDGVTIDRYACTNEWEQNAPDGVGTFVHEFSHVMGLPDLYTTDYGSAEYVTPGAWSVMDYGPYNNDGRTPPAYSAWERNAMGWIDLEELKPGEGRSVELPSVTSSNKAFVVATSKTNEFFVIENRQQEGWDYYVPGHGMLVWHIDYNASKWSNNTVNNTKSHQYVDIEEANGSANNQSDATMAGYTFPGTSRKTSFTSTTNPAMKTWSGVAIDAPITNIKESKGVITFDVCGGENSQPDPDDPEQPVDPADPDSTMATFVFTGSEAYGMEIGEYNPKTYDCGEGIVTLTLNGNTRWWAATGGNALRFYKGSNFVVSIPQGWLINRIEIEGTPTDWKLDSESTGSYTNGTWTGSADSVQLNMTKTSGNSSITKIMVYYKSTQPRFMPGDANGDGEVNVTDIVSAVEYIMGRNPGKFVFEAADVNNDKEINVTDVVNIANIILKKAAE